MSSLAVVGGTIATEHGVFKGDILIRGDRIESISVGDPSEAEETIDARGLVIFPGGLDPHCHFRDPGSLPREGWLTGSSAAAAGGVTTVLEYPQAEPPVVDEETFLLKRHAAEAQSVVDFALWGGAIEVAIPHLADMHGLGAVGFKAFMYARNPLFPGIDDGVVLEVLEATVALGSILALHCENPAIQLRRIKRLQAEGRVGPRAHSESRPPIVEIEAVSRFITLAASIEGARVHVPHVTLAEVAELVRDAKRRGLSITAEVCPQHLILDELDLDRLGVWAKCAPPLRSREKVEALWPFVLDGTIDYHASDHAAYTVEEKEAGNSNIFLAPTGIINNQFAIPLILDEAVNKRGMSLDHFARYSSTNAAKRLGLYPRKGTIQPGSDADIVLYDMNASDVVDSRLLLNRQQWTPFDGRAIGTKVMRTIVRGRTVFDGQQIVVDPGYGRFLPRTYGTSGVDA